MQVMPAISSRLGVWWAYSMPILAWYIPHFTENDKKKTCLV